MPTRDILGSLATGLISALIVWPLTIFWGISHPWGVSTALLLLALPALFLAAVWVGEKLSRWIPFLQQFARFSAVGFTNTAVDFGGLNLCIYSSGSNEGWIYSGAKTLSFAVCIVHSYLWNKHWTFDAGNTNNGRSELARFVALGCVVLACDVAVASVLVNVIGPVGGIHPRAWANLGGAAGAASALFINFYGMRAFVFAKKTRDTPAPRGAPVQA